MHALVPSFVLSFFRSFRSSTIYIHTHALHRRCVRARACACSSLDATRTRIYASAIPLVAGRCTLTGIAYPSWVFLVTLHRSYQLGTCGFLEARTRTEPSPLYTTTLSLSLFLLLFCSLLLRLLIVSSRCLTADGRDWVPLGCETKANFRTIAATFPFWQRGNGEENRNYFKFSNFCRISTNIHNDNFQKISPPFFEISCV